MKLKFMNFFEVEGNEEQLATYSYYLIQFLNHYSNVKCKEEARKEAMAIAKAVQSSFADLVKQERDDNESSGNNNKGENT